MIASWFKTILSKTKTHSLLNNIAKYNIQGRELHSFNGQPRPEVVIGSHSMIFATLLSINKHRQVYGSQAHSQLKLIVPPFWLLNAHPDHDYNHWGQTPRELLAPIEDIYWRLNKVKSNGKSKDKNREDKIFWCEYKAIINSSLDMLNDRFNIPIYKGILSIIKTNNNDFLFIVSSKTNYSSFVIPNDVFVYDWHREFAIEPNLPSDIKQVSYTNLYFIPKEDAPRKILILGDGESIIWLSRDFPNSTIYYLSSSKDKQPFVKRIKPSHSNLPLDNVKKIYFDSSDKVHLKKIKRKYTHDDDSRSFNYIEYIEPETGEHIEGAFFVNIGFERKNYSSIIPNENTLRLADQPKENQNFVAPKNIPPGGLSQSLIIINETTSNLDLIEDYQIYHQEVFETLMREKARKHGLELPSQYFQFLSEQIKSLDTRLPEERYKELMFNEYKKLKPSDSEISKFTQLLLEIKDSNSIIKNETGSSE